MVVLIGRVTKAKTSCRIAGRRAGRTTSVGAEFRGFGALSVGFTR